MKKGNSLELRVPFLDHVLDEFASRLPAELKVKGSTTKYLLKKWAERLLPTEIVYRSNKGFPVPTKTWFRSDLAGFAREPLLATEGPVRHFFSQPAAEHLLATHQRGNRTEQIYRSE